MKKEACGFLLILLAGIIFRILFLLDFASLPVLEHVSGADVSAYFEAAQRIRTGEWLWQHPGIHAPLYPYFLAVILSVCKCDILWTRLIQSILLLFLTFFPLYSILRQRTAELSGMIRFLPQLSIFLLAVYPPFVIFQCDFFSENLMIVFLLFSLWSLQRHFKAAVFLSGIFAGLAMLSHPGCIFFLPFTLIYTFLFPRTGWKKGLFRSTLWGLGVLLLLLPVILYNSIQEKQFVFVQKNSMFNLWLGNHSGATGTCMIPPGIRWDREFQRSADKAEMLKTSVDSIYRKEWAEYLFRHPVDYTCGLFRKAALALSCREFTTWSDISSMKLIFWHKYMYHGWFLILLMLGGPMLLIGMFDRHFRRFMMPLLLIAATVFASQIFFVTAGRYRMALIVPLSVCGAYFLCTLPRQLSTFRRNILFLFLMIILFAVSVYPHAISMQPERDYARSVLGGAFLAAKNPAAAIALYQDSGAGNSFPERKLSLLGQAWYMQNDLKQAEKYFREAVENFPQQSSNWLNYATVLSESGKRGAALEYLQQARKYASEPTVMADIEYNTGEIFHRTGQLKTAEQYYLKALEYNPTHRKALNNLGAIQIAMKQPEKALLYFSSASSLEPENIRLKVNCALALAMLNRTAEAEAILHQVLQQDPSCVPARQLLQKMKK